MAFQNKDRVCSLLGAGVRQDGRLFASSTSVQLSFLPAVTNNEPNAAAAGYHIQLVSSDPAMCGWWLGATGEDPHTHACSDAGGRWPLFVEEKQEAMRWAVEPEPDAGDDGDGYVRLRCLGPDPGDGEAQQQRYQQLGGIGAVWICLDELKYSCSYFHLLKLRSRADARVFVPSDGGPLPSHSDVRAYRAHLRNLLAALGNDLGVGNTLFKLPEDILMLIASYTTDIRLVFNPEPGPSLGHFTYLMLPKMGTEKDGDGFPTHGNFSSYAAGGASPGQHVITTWQAVRLDLETLVVKCSDFRFSSSTGGITHSSTTRNDSNWIRRVDFATAADCAGGGRATGRARVDLTGTEFTTDDVFEPCGCGPCGEALLSDNKQVVNLSGGGYCGDNKGRRVQGGLQLVHLPGSLLERAMAME